VAVFGAPDERWAERVHAVVVPQPGAELTGEVIAQPVRNRIAGNKVPRCVEIRTEPLPKSAAGKVLKRKRRDPLWEDRKARVS
jgi:long-chain acyl-CoA synthetase